MEKNSLNIVDLFCGCGGLSLGFLRAGFNIVLGVDIDKAAVRSFKENHPSSCVLCTDITTVQDQEILKIIGPKKIDLIIGGPPCQGLSLSGPRKMNDPRNGLFYSYVRMTKLLNPKAFVLENVPGLLSLYKGQIKDAIFKEFQGLGYQISSQVLLAADFGVPQTRKRVFFVGTKSTSRQFKFPFPKHYPEGNLLGLPRYITCEEAINDLPPLEYSIGESPSDYYLPPQNQFQEKMRECSPLLWNHVGTKHSDHVKQIISLVPDGGNYKDLPEELRKTRNFNIAWTRYHSKKPAYTIDTGHRHYFHYQYNRVPTVREHARLQTFPDRFIFYGNKSEQNRQVGNAVPPLLAQALAEELKKCL
ncbi:MAG: DNA cytosine methyltransferase [Bacteroidales bacterium]|nr:DNA cytosine methyltransferase [Bacteroidales bacterium]